jgi:hypothetical protein
VHESCCVLHDFWIILAPARNLSEYLDENINKIKSDNVVSQCEGRKESAVRFLDVDDSTPAFKIAGQC